MHLLCQLGNRRWWALHMRGLKCTRRVHILRQLRASWVRSRDLCMGLLDSTHDREHHCGLLDRRHWDRLPERHCSGPVLLRPIRQRRRRLGRPDSRPVRDQRQHLARSTLLRPRELGFHAARGFTVRAVHTAQPRVRPDWGMAGGMWLDSDGCHDMGADQGVVQTLT
jgi:hypothetical protein